MGDRESNNFNNKNTYKSTKNVSYEKVGYEQRAADKQASKLSEITKAITKKDKG